MTQLRDIPIRAPRGADPRVFWHRVYRDYRADMLPSEYTRLINEEIQYKADMDKRRVAGQQVTVDQYRNSPFARYIKNMEYYKAQTVSTDNIKPTFFFKVASDASEDLQSGDRLLQNYPQLITTHFQYGQSRDSDVFEVQGYRIDFSDHDSVPILSPTTSPDRIKEYAAEHNVDAVLIGNPPKTLKGKANIQSVYVANPDVFTKTFSRRIDSYNPLISNPTRYTIDFVPTPKGTLYHGTPVNKAIDELEPNHLISLKSKNDCKGIFLTNNPDVAKLYTQSRQSGNAAQFIKSPGEWKEKYGNFIRGDKSPGGSIVQAKLDWQGLEEIPHVHYDQPANIDVELRWNDFVDSIAETCDLAHHYNYPAIYYSSRRYSKEPELIIFDADRVGVDIQNQHFWGPNDKDFSTPVSQATTTSVKRRTTSDRRKEDFRKRHAKDAETTGMPLSTPMVDWSKVESIKRDVPKISFGGKSRAGKSPVKMPRLPGR